MRHFCLLLPGCSMYLDVAVPRGSPSGKGASGMTIGFCSGQTPAQENGSSVYVYVYV